MGTSLPGWQAVCARAGPGSIGYHPAMRKVAFALGVLVAVGALVWWRWPRRRGATGGSGSGAGTSGSDAPVTSTPGDLAHGAPSGQPRGTPAAHQLLVQQIERARQRRLAEAARAGVAPPSAPATAAPRAADPPGDSPLDGALAKDYIRDVVREIKPLLVECYENAMQGKPELEAGGKLVVAFKLSGEPGVGGVVEDSRILTDQSTLAGAADFSQCVQETMYALRFDPPSAGGTIDVTYPFLFSAEEPDGGN